jgi:hypothetical protein
MSNLAMFVLLALSNFIIIYLLFRLMDQPLDENKTGLGRILTIGGFSIIIALAILGVRL